jgi:hypothetical protein
MDLYYFRKLNEKKSTNTCYGNVPALPLSQLVSRLRLSIKQGPQIIGE